MLKSETNASMIHQPVISRTEWKCENVRCNNPTVAVRLSQTIGLAGSGQQGDEANTKMEECNAEGDGYIWLEFHARKWPNEKS